jgi:hypothetical protein
LDPSTLDPFEPDHPRDHHRNDHERHTDHEDSLTCTHAAKCTPVWPPRDAEVLETVWRGYPTG